MSPQRPSRAERWLVSLVVVALFAGFLLAAGALGSALGIRQGVLRGPSLDLNFGAVRIMAGTDEYPNCNPAHAACSARGVQPAGAHPLYYTIWLVTTHNGVGSSGSPQEFGGVRALSIQAGP